MIEGILLLVLISILLRLLTLAITTYPERRASPLAELIDSVARLLKPNRDLPKGEIWQVTWVGSAPQRLREEVILPRLAAVGMQGGPTPPLPQVSLLPPETISEEEMRRIIEASRFYRELKEAVTGQERLGTIVDAPRANARDVKATVPIPDDPVEERIIETIRREAQGQR